jgi:hypothetical protein
VRACACALCSVLATCLHHVADQPRHGALCDVTAGGDTGLFGAVFTHACTVHPPHPPLPPSLSQPSARGLTLCHTYIVRITRQGAAEETAAPNPRKSGPTHALRVVLITLWLVLSGASSQVCCRTVYTRCAEPPVTTDLAAGGLQISFYATGQDMAGYPMFLLYFCNGCYGLGYFVILGITVLVATYGSSSSSSSSGGGGRGGGQTDTRLPYEGTKSPLLESHSSARDSGAPGVYEQVVGSRYEQVMFVLIGVCTGLSLEMQQYANGKVNVDLQTVLYQLYLPSTAICSMLYLRTKLSPFNVLGAAGVFCSIVLVACGGPAADSGSAVVSSPPPCNQTLAWLLHNCTEASCYSCYEGFCASDQPVVAPSCVPSPPPQCGPSLLGWNPQFNGTAPKLNGTIASRISHAKKMCDDYSKCRGFALNSTSTHDNTILFFGATPNFTQSAVPSSNFTTFWKGPVQPHLPIPAPASAASGPSAVSAIFVLCSLFYFRGAWD